MVFRAFCVKSVLPLEKKQIHLVFLSLIRTSDLKVQGTHVRESKRNLVFLFGFCSLNRTFVCEIY